MALLVALTVNRRVSGAPERVPLPGEPARMEAVITSLQPQHLGTVYRTFRLAEFVAALWLLSPWWGRRDLLLVRCHLGSLAVVQGTVILGLLVAPGMPSTAAGSAACSGVSRPRRWRTTRRLRLGLVVVLWLGGLLSGKADPACRRGRGHRAHPHPYQDRPDRAWSAVS